MECSSRDRLRRTSIVTAAVAAVAALAGFGILSNAQAEQATALHETALHAVQVEARLGDQLASSSTKVLADGRAAVAAASGKTLDVKVSAEAKKHLTTLDQAARALTDAAATARKAVRANTGAHVAYWRLAELDARLGKVSLAPERTALLTAEAAVTADKRHLTDAVTAWKKEQERLAAEKAAKAKAEQATQEQAAAAQAASRQTATPSRSTPAGENPVTAAPHHTAPHDTPAAAPAPAPAVQSKLSIAQGVFARYGFTNVTYGPGVAMGHYGATSLDAQHIYIDLDRIPAERVASVAIHEYQHIKQARMYGGYDATVAHYGSVIAMERAADQMARADGATWTNYA